MNTLEFFNEFVHPSCHKYEHTMPEFQKIKALPNVMRIKATTFYQIYKHNVFGADGERLSMRAFFHVCGQYVYYDKYICEHGTEFYYYIVFNEAHQIYTLTKSVLLRRVEASAPHTLKDLQYVVEAVSKEETYV